MYRLATYALVRAWDDALQLVRNRITAPVASQLYRAVGSVGGNIAEGYSRSSGRDRMRIYEYALGSVRESAHWYRAGSPLLGQAVVADRLSILHRITCTLLVAIPAERARDIRPSKDR